MRVTSKGQVTIPADIREQTGILPNTEVAFVRDGSEIRIRKVKHGVKPSRGEELVRRLRGTGDVKMTTDEIMALTRGR